MYAYHLRVYHPHLCVLRAISMSPACATIVPLHQYVCIYLYLYTSNLNCQELSASWLEYSIHIQTLILVHTHQHTHAHTLHTHTHTRSALTPTHTHARTHTHNAVSCCATCTSCGRPRSYCCGPLLRGAASGLALLQSKSADKDPREGWPFCRPRTERTIGH